MLWIPFRLVYQHRRWQPERSTSAANDRPHPYHDRRHGWWTGLTLALLFNGLQPTPSGAAQTEIYRSTGESNEPLYTDTPASPDAREVELPPPSSVEMRPDVEAQRRLAVPASPDRGRERPSHTRSTSAHADFAIARPAPDAAVRSNQGQVQVVLELPDALEPGQRVLLYMDGTRQGADAGTGTVILDAIERGTHTLVAEIVSADGRTIARTDPRRFHLLRASAINQPGGPDLPGGAGSTSR